MRQWCISLLVLSGVALFCAFAPMRAAGQTAVPYPPPRTPDGNPDLQGIWQVLNTAARDIQDHHAQLGIPADQGVVEGNEITRPWKMTMTLYRRKEPRTLVVGTSALILAGAIGAAAALSGDAVSQGLASPSPSLVTQAQYEKWQMELSNWGRWGRDDEMGTLNLITPAKRKAALALVREGFPVSLATNAHTEKSTDVPCPAEWAMTAASETGATDRVAFPCIHGAATTHLDSLAHTFFSGKMWNGYPVSRFVTKENGAAKNSVLTMKNGIVTRAVLYDIPRLKGVPYLEPGARIFAEDLEAWERKVGVRVAAGDALILRWGRWARSARVGHDEGAAGLDNSVLPWLKQRDISLLVWETAGYEPQPAGDLPRTAIHNFVQAILGIHVLDRGDFEALSEAAASRNRWEFMLTVAPLPIAKGTGSPVNPIAMF